MKRIFLLALPILLATQAAADAVRVRRRVEWPVVASTAPAAMAAETRSAIGGVGLPVLLPPNLPADATLTTARDLYSAAFEDRGASVSIDGTRVAYIAAQPMVPQMNVPLRGRQGFASITEDIPVVTWNEYGAAYKVALECARGAADERCTSTDAVVAIAQSLVFAGGSGQALSEEREPIAVPAGAPPALPAASFSFRPAGDLVSGSGTGQARFQELVPAIRFPIEKAPAFANSQVFGNGGMHGPAGTKQCDGVNLSFPWSDNFCETRAGRKNALCPAKEGHQGQDIRAADCKKDIHRGVAVVDGVISAVGSYSVTLTDPVTGVQYRYLHMSHVAVKKGDKVHRGNLLGLVSNIMPPDGTTVHLHFETWLNIDGFGFVSVGPYTALVAAYQRLLAETAATAAPAAATAIAQAEGTERRPDDFDVEPAVRGYPAFNLPPWAYAATTIAWWIDAPGATPEGTASRGGKDFVAALARGEDLGLPAIQALGAALGLQTSNALDNPADAYALMFRASSPGWFVVVTGQPEQVTRMFVVAGVHKKSDGTLRAHILDPECDRRSFMPVTLQAGEKLRVLVKRIP